ncbi:N-acetyldiaminopimelate deacetylase [Streptomyces alboniger]
MHTTVSIGVARVLARLRHHLSGTAVFLFQPAEEALSGARALIDPGVLEREHVEEIHALHCGPFPVGQFAVTPGYGMPGQDKAEVTLSGPDAVDAARRLAVDIGALATVALPQTPADLERIIAESQTPDRRLGPVRGLAGGSAGGEGECVLSLLAAGAIRGGAGKHSARLAKPYAGAGVRFPLSRSRPWSAPNTAACSPTTCAAPSARTWSPNSVPPSRPSAARTSPSSSSSSPVRTPSSVSSPWQPHHNELSALPRLLP